MDWSDLHLGLVIYRGGLQDMLKWNQVQYSHKVGLYYLNVSVVYNQTARFFSAGQTYLIHAK